MEGEGFRNEEPEGVTEAGSCPRRSPGRPRRTQLGALAGALGPLSLIKPEEIQLWSLRRAFLRPQGQIATNLHRVETWFSLR